MPKLCPNITFPHQQDCFPIRSVTKSWTARFSHENLVEKFKIFVQDFVPIRTALMLTKNLYENGPNRGGFFGTKNLSEGHLMHTVFVCYVFDNLGQACLCE